MSVIIKGDSAFDMSLVSNIKNVQSSHIKFQNIYFKCKSIEDAGGTIFVKRKKGKWIANGDIHKECPFCGEDWDKYVFGDIWYTGELPKFCPNCGEDMRGEQE